MPREKRTHVICVPCWRDRPKANHESWQCADARCVCCGFKELEARVKAQKAEAGA